MNRLLCICVMLISQLVLYAQNSYTLTLQASPQNSAYFNNESTEIEEGSMLRLYAYPERGYVFDRWEENGNTVSTDQYFYYTMPSHNTTLTAVCHFDPSVPDNPISPAVLHWMTLESNPKQAGWFNWGNRTQVVEGTEMDVYAYDHNSYRFVEWQMDGETVSKDHSYKFIVPNTDIHLVAVYEFAPVTPPNPGRNYLEGGEAIIDDFSDGYGLYDAVWFVSNGELDKITSLTVIGKFTEDDWFETSRLPNCGIADFSRTTGLTYVPSMLFREAQSLNSIILPASIRGIGYGAFSGCDSLTNLTLLSTVPPQVESGTFAGSNSDNFVVYVPAASVSLYKATDVWKDLDIRPLKSQVKSLQVTIDKNKNDIKIYKGMYLELYNVKSGQRQRYVITDSYSYTFPNLMHNTEYNVYLRDSKDRVLGSLSEVKIDTLDTKVTLSSLQVPRTVTMLVKDPAGKDVTSQVTITWMEADGTYLSRGSQLAAQLDGTELKYRITLPQDLAMQYQLPEERTYVVSENTQLSYKLTVIPQITISGTVLENKGGQPLSRAAISISQVFNGQYTKSYSTQTNENGQWQMTVLQAPTEISASKIGFVSKTEKYAVLEAQIPTFTLEDITGTTISLNLTYTKITGETITGYVDSINVAYSVYNVTDGKAITDFSLQYPKIVLRDTNKSKTFRITAISKVQKFMPVEATITIGQNDDASVNLNIKELGGIRASYVKTDNTSIVGILYDANGKLVAKYDYDAENKLEISELQDGEYTLVTMAGSQFFNSIFSLSQFNNSGLREGIDFLKNRVQVESGEISKISNQIIPYLDETKLYYTSTKTSFTVNKSQVSAGQFLTLSAFINFKNAYASGVSNVKLIVNMPASTKFVESSVMVGNATASYTYDEANHSVVIPVANLSDRIRFCIIPTAGGTYSPAASVQFKFDGKTFTQPIGSVTYNVKDLSITVPEVVNVKSVPVSGSAVGKSNVKVYVDDVLLAQTTSLANGSWATNVDLLLDDENVQSTHTVYAVITSQDGLEMQSESQVVTFDPQAIQLEKVTMYYTNPEENCWRGKNYELVHNFLTPSLKPLRYIYYIYNRSFTFAINFSNNYLVTDVILEVKTGDGRWNTLTTKQDVRNNGRWLAYGEFGNMYDGIVPVNVRVKYKFGDTVFVVPYPGPDADVPIDPSGYVYEAVPSNRLQGVTATIYYKETGEDQYGDPYEREVEWDAEEYAQQNPLFTDENGMYRWDVPQGLWRVKFEKEGYETTYSEWLPVPPPQLDVNIAMTQLQQPNVSASADEEGVDIEFDKFMDPATLTTDNIFVSLVGEVDTTMVYGNIELLNEEIIDKNSAKTYASKVRFNMPKDSTMAYTQKVNLTVSSNVKTYAGVPLGSTYSQEFIVKPKVKGIQVDSVVNVEYGEEHVRTLTITAWPADVAKQKKLKVNVLSREIAKVSATELELDENGQTELTLTGEMPGSTVITFEIEGVDLTKHVQVNVKEPELLKTIAPRASRVSGSQVYRNAKVLLTSDTENAVIYYTLDGSEPTDSTAFKFSEDHPIEIKDDSVTIKAVAYGHDMKVSDVAQFDYTLKKSIINYQLQQGWSWISHNLEQPVVLSTLNAADIECLKSQMQEVIKDPDPAVGLIGNLKAMNPGETYKIKVAEEVSIRLDGFECDAAATAVPVMAGWNWLGYPINQEMTVAEALSFYEASEGDFIVGYDDGWAQFAEGKWNSSENFKLVPGKGYMFKAMSTNDIVFNNTFVSEAASRMSQRSNLSNSPWTPAKYAYPNVMPLTAELYLDGAKADADDFIVGAFSDSECRGVGFWNEGRLMMTVYGDGGEDIRFVAKNLTDGICYDITEQVNFTADNVGTWHEPYALTVGGESTKVKEINSDLSVTPSVVRDHITVSAAGRYISSLTLTNMGGRVVVSLTDLGKGATITTSQLPAGVYIVTVKADGQTFYKKIIKS